MNAANDPENDSPLQFPCEFPIKVMGRQAPDFEASILALISSHFGEIGPERVRSRASTNGSFISVTVTVQAESRAQLDAAYRSLTAAEQVLFVL